MQELNELVTYNTFRVEVVAGWVGDFIVAF